MFSFSKNLPLPEHFPLHDQFEKQISLLQSFTGKAVESAEKFLELNLHASQDSIEHTRAVAQKLLAAKSAQEFFSHSSELFKPNLEHLLNYSRKLIHIATETQAEVLQAVTKKASKSEKEFVKLVVETEKNAEYLLAEVSHSVQTAAKEVGAVLEGAVKEVSAKHTPAKVEKSEKATIATKAVKSASVKPDAADKAQAKASAKKTGNFPAKLPAAPVVTKVKPATSTKASNKDNNIAEAVSAKQVTVVAVKPAAVATPVEKASTHTSTISEPVAALDNTPVATVTTTVDSKAE